MAAEGVIASRGAVNYPESLTSQLIAAILPNRNEAALCRQAIFVVLTPICPSLSYHVDSSKSLHYYIEPSHWVILIVLVFGSNKTWAKGVGDPPSRYPI